MSIYVTAWRKFSFFQLHSWSRALPACWLWLALALQLCRVCPAGAAITEVAYWRMGEDDPHPGLGQALSTIDSIGGRTLHLVGAPFYDNARSAAAIADTGSIYCMHFFGSSNGGTYGIAPLIPSLVNNFGVELWVQTARTNQNPSLFYNGNPGNSGWGIYAAGTNCQGVLGGVTLVGSGLLPLGVWTHVALVVDNGLATLYINGVAAGAPVPATANPPGGTNLAIAINASSLTQNSFDGYMDEVRVFTFVATQFSTNDLLINAGAPTATSTAATSAIGTSATLNGTVDPNGLDSTYYFQYGIDTNYGSNTLGGPIAASTSPVAVNDMVSGLATNTVYHFRVVAQNSVSTAFGNDLTFTAGHLPPGVITGAATSVTTSTATLNGSVDPYGVASAYRFQYGTTTNYGTLTTTSSLPATNAILPAAKAVSGLTFGTLYHFQILASNSLGTNSGADATFTTLIPPPAVTTGLATFVSNATVVLSGTVNPNQVATSYYFQYGLATNYGNFSATNSLPATNLVLGAPAPINLPTVGLWHYQLVATSAGGTVTGADATFSTAAPVVFARSQSLGWLSVNAPTNTLTAGGIVSGPTNFVVQQFPTNGQLVQLPGFATNGQWIYLPIANNPVDVDGFTFAAFDGFGDASRVATVSIAVTNIPFAFNQAVAWPPAPFSTNALTGLVANGPTNFSIYQYPTNGQIFLQPGFSTNGLWSYAPFSTNFAGTDSFLFRVTDNGGNISLPGVVGITTTNAPLAFNQSVATIVGNIVTNTLRGIVRAGSPTNFIILQAPTNGIFTQLPGFSTNGQWTYTLINSITNLVPASFTFYVADKFGNTSAPATVSILTTPRYFAYSQSVSWLENTFPTNQLTGVVFSGPTEFLIETPPLYGHVYLLANGSWTYQPNTRNFYGTDGFAFMVANNTGGISLPGFINITVTNSAGAAPFAHLQYLKTRPGQQLPITLSGDDDANDLNSSSIVPRTRDIRDWNPVFTVLTNPTNGYLSGAAPDLVYTPTNANVFDSFTFKVNNGALDSPPAKVMIKVANYNIGTNYFSPNFSANLGNTNQGADVPTLNPGTIRPGFESNALDRSDETSLEVFLADRLNRPLMWTFNGVQFSNLWVNDNGLLSFTNPGYVFVPQPFPYSLGVPMVAPLWCDVDTTLGGGLITYGSGYVTDGIGSGHAAGRPAFLVTWNDVSFYGQELLPSQTRVYNRFQVVLIDRSDLRPGYYDAEFNYEYIEWFGGLINTNSFPTAGFDDGQSNFYYNLPNSSSAQITNLITTSSENPPTPGRWLMRLYTQTFPPSLVSGAAANVTPTNAALTAMVNPNGIWTATTFVLTNLTLSNSMTLVGPNLPSGISASTLVSASIGNLAPGCVYGVSAIASNEFGLSTNSFTFATPPRLASISLNTGSLTPAFDPGVTGYLSPASNASTATLQVTAENLPALFYYQINGGGYVPYGSAAQSATFPPFSLKPGPNPLNVKIVSQNGAATNIYTIDIVNSSNTVSSLASLGVSQGSLAPVFNASTLSYSATVSNGVTSLIVSASTTFSNATVQISGDLTLPQTNSAPVSLSVGSNFIPIVVIAEDGVSKTTYALSITRLRPSNSALGGLRLASGSIIPTFTPPFAYSATVSNSVTNLSVVAWPADPLATVGINGGALVTNTNSTLVTLALGTNSIPIVVTAQDGVTTSTYTLTVNRTSGAPVVTNLPATSITKTNALLNATVNPLGTNAIVYFQYGPNTSYGATTTSTNIPVSIVAQNISLTASNLSAGTTYHYRAVASNFFGATTSSDLSFVTIGIPVTLNIARTASWPPPAVILSWPTNAIGAVLQSSDLSLPVAWHPVTNQVTVITGSNTVTVNVSTNTQFYRLNYP